jgi:hypothetical protein
MLIQGIMVAAIATMLGQTVEASEKPTALRHMSCTLVRLYVAKYSESAAESWARSKGATDAEIETGPTMSPGFNRSNRELHEIAGRRRERDSLPDSQYRPGLPPTN